MRRILCVLLALAMLAGLGGCARQPQRQSVTWFDLFDTVTILLGYTGTEAEFSEQAAAVYKDLEHCHRLFDIYNTYEGMNNLKTINDNAGVAPVEVEQPVIDLILLAKRLYEQTDGQVNIAMGSVLELWHDAREAAEADPSTAYLPDEQALREAAAHTDISKVIVDEEAKTVFLEDPKMKLDVGSVGKGYAVELAAQAAEERGLTSALLSVGGNLRAIGRKPGEQKWSGAIQDPWTQEANAVSPYTVELESGMALVTSGDYQRYFTVDGVRYHHIIDPDTLQPAAWANSVSVLYPDSGVADALSTALFNLSPEEGLALIESIDGAEAMWMLPGREVIFSSGFEESLREKAE